MQLSEPAAKPNAQASAPPYARLAAGMFLLLLVVSLAGGYAVYGRLAGNLEARNEAMLTRVAEIESAGIAHWIRERGADAAVFSSARFLGDSMQEWNLRGATDESLRRRVREQLQLIKTRYDYIEVAIHESDGSIRVTSEDIIAPPDEVTAEIVQRALDSNATEISALHVAAVNGGVTPVIDLATPLPDAAQAQGRSADQRSVLMLRASAGFHLAPLAASAAKLPAQTGALLTEIRNGSVVVAAGGGDTQLFRHLDTLPVSPDDLRARVGGGRQFMLRAKDGTELYAVARQIAGVPWYLLSVTTRDSVRAGVSRIAWGVGTVWLAALALFAAVLLLWWRHKDSEHQLRALQAASEHRLLRRRYDFLSRYANDAILLADDAGRVVEANDKAGEMLDCDRAAVIGTPLVRLFPDDSRAVLEDALTRLHPGAAAQFDLSVMHRGEQRWLEISARAIDLDGRQIVQFVCRDITERRQAEAALRASEEKLNNILSTVVDVIWSVSPDLNRLNYVNASVERVFGLTPSALFERPRLWMDLLHPEDRPAVEAHLRSLSGEHPVYDIEYRILRADGCMRWLHCRGLMVFDAVGTPLHFDRISTDITERKSAEQQVQMLAYYDSITGLPNRQLLNDRLAQALPMAQRKDGKVALLYMDLDNFKHINDSRGHLVGDLLLREVGHRLAACVREEDTVARIGGDEFLVMLPELDRGGQAATVAEKILAATARPYRPQDIELHTTVSIGISVFPDDARDATELVQHADSAMYQAKGYGRANYQFFTEELNLQITRSTEIERQLRQAIDGGELSLWYQPQIDARDGRMVGAEALLRWRRADGRYLSPLEFIPIAEERGLINRIGEWVMREACAQCRRWQELGLQPVPVAVNVSPIQFQQKGFASQVTGILAETRLDATLLELEITESAIMRRASQVAELATHLREVGVGISIDDFGTGYSSLSYLKQIPIDKIKIDRSFITDMLIDEDDHAITSAIVSLAHSLKLRVIAEGVESHAQIERLRSFGCDEVQGHYFSQAVSASEFQGFLARGGVLQGAFHYHGNQAQARLLRP